MPVICKCKRRLPVVMGTDFCARCTVDLHLSGGTTCLSTLEQECERRENEERAMWDEREIEQECDDFTQALDELEW